MSTIRRLIGILVPYQKWIWLAAILNFVTIGSSVGLMAMSAYLISKAAIVHDVADLALAITAVRLFAILRAVFRYLERYLSHTATFRILTHLRVWFYQAIEPLAPARLQPFHSGDLLARSVADIETLENFYIRVLVPPLAAALVTILACLILGSFDVILAVALLIFLVLTGLLLPGVTRWLGKQPAGQLVETRAELTAQMIDEIHGLADLLVFDRADQHRTRLMGLSDQFNQCQERMALLRGVSNGLAALFASLSGLTVLWLAIPLVTGGQIEGVYLALLPLTAMASFEAVQPLALAMGQLEANQAAARRLFELIDAAPEVRDPEHPASAAKEFGIVVRDLTFRYTPDDPLALERLSFTVPPGSKAAFVGPSGAGKTTLVNLLLRFWDYEKGQIVMGGHDLHAYGADEVRSWFGVVSQNVHLFNATVKDNLLLANPDATDAEIEEACRLAELDDFIHSLPLKYDTLVGENGLSLSGGERQRLAIARALLKNAPVLILDEATANLDAITEQKLMGSLQNFMKGRTVLIISHRPTLTTGVDQIIRFDHPDLTE